MTENAIDICEFIEARFRELHPYHSLWRFVEVAQEIVEFHKNFPILVETEPKLDVEWSGIDEINHRLTAHIMWQTNMEYVKKFGEQPPTTSIIRKLAQIWQNHPDFRDEWRY